MTFVSQHLLEFILVCAAVGGFAFVTCFHKIPIIESGQTITPKWFSPIFWIGAIGFLILFITQIPFLGRFLVQVIFGIRQNTNNLAATLLLLLCICLSYGLCHVLGTTVREKIIAPAATAFFDEDDVVQKLIRDIENGTKEVRIYQTRLEGLRSFRFDVDGYNRPAFSVHGCKEMAYYLNRRFPGTFNIQVCQDSDGVGTTSGVNVTNNGPRYRFSHIAMTRK